MEAREFFLDNDFWQKLDDSDKSVIEQMLFHIENDPAALAHGLITAEIECGKLTKDCVLGILIGFAASDNRFRFNKGN